MGRFESRGVVLSNGLTLDAFGNGHLVLTGTIECAGGICVEVHKIIQILDGEGANARVQSATYTYHARLRGRGNILRYDAPHESHRPFHHVHRYDPRLKGHDETVEAIAGEEWPTLGEVLTELEVWYFENADWIERS